MSPVVCGAVLIELQKGLINMACIKMNEYRAMKSRHQQEADEFPFFFAFSQKQFGEGMSKFGLQPGDTDKIYKLGTTGGFYLRTDADRLHEMLERHGREVETAIANDSTGDGFIFEMFNYELADREYCVSGDVTATLDALGLTFDEVNGDARLLRGLKKAIKAQERYG
jgi:hypothetical protein